jgi:hypothetical protein
MDNNNTQRRFRGRLSMLTFAAGLSMVNHMAAQTPAAPPAQATPQAAQRPGDVPPAPAPAQTGAPAAPDAAVPDAPADSSDAADAQQQDGDAKLTSTPGAKALGISILGNQEAPTSLVIVPWKSSELGNSPGISPMLDDSRQPVDKDVFMRALRYYEIRSEPAGQGGVTTTGSRDNAAAGSGAVQPSAARRR